MNSNINQQYSKRITVTGASGVGKTTLAKLVSEQLTIPLIPEIARDVCTRLGYNRIGEVPDQEGFKRKVLQEQIENEAGFDAFISDRSAIDCWILWQRWNICSAMTYATEAIYQQVKQHVSNYSHIIYVPPLFPPVDDGFRWIEPDYIKQIDRITRMTFFDLNLWDRVYTIKSDGADARVAEIMDWLKQSISQE